MVKYPLVGGVDSSCLSLVADWFRSKQRKKDLQFRAKRDRWIAKTKVPSHYRDIFHLSYWHPNTKFTKLLEPALMFVHHNDHQKRKGLGAYTSSTCNWSNELKVSHCCTQSCLLYKYKIWPIMTWLRKNIKIKYIKKYRKLAHLRHLGPTHNVNV